MMASAACTRLNERSVAAMEVKVLICLFQYTQLAYQKSGFHLAQLSPLTLAILEDSRENRYLLRPPDSRQ
jgi:hypothetical protein